MGPVGTDPGPGAASEGGWRRLADCYWRRRFAWLFGSLLVTLGLYPSVRALGVGVVPMRLLLAVSVLLAVVGVTREESRRSKLALGALLLVITGVQAAVGRLSLLGLTEALWVMAGLLAIMASVRRALRPGRADAERILAALDAYLLAGLLFGVWYWMIEQAWPGSFQVAAGGALSLSRAVYFSFVTIATLGYGDIVPASDPARGLAVLEAVGGQMYLAVLIARLVTLYSADADR
jgi:hypothetical protein